MNQITNNGTNKKTNNSIIFYLIWDITIDIRAINFPIETCHGMPLLNNSDTFL